MQGDRLTEQIEQLVLPLVQPGQLKSMWRPLKTYEDKIDGVSKGPSKVTQPRRVGALGQVKGQCSESEGKEASAAKNAEKYANAALFAMRIENAVERVEIEMLQGLVRPHSGILT